MLFYFVTQNGGHVNEIPNRRVLYRKSYTRLTLILPHLFQQAISVALTSYQTTSNVVPHSPGICLVTRSEVTTCARTTRPVLKTDGWQCIRFHNGDRFQTAATIKNISTNKKKFFRIYRRHGRRLSKGIRAKIHVIQSGDFVGEKAEKKNTGRHLRDIYNGRHSWAPTFLLPTRYTPQYARVLLRLSVRFRMKIRSSSRSAF